MKSYLFTTETDRGGVMLCDIEEFDKAVSYLCNRFDGVVKIESAEEVWQLDGSEPSASSESVDSASGASAPQMPEQSGAPAESDDLFA
ncbi:hypothetical protein [Amphritea japonica]|uniref:Uncharacterized protein n=1 Tax=Amphritea japonica ATCC BAA-1530 TaxID=1278309 RepID=A0A7R6P3G0_9GAMM|nr:hypothetical protein [Amphritea japonica]BBB26493.1 conserved hypothetical protein [Amphritea japonica ATCC BAA-1530]